MSGDEENEINRFVDWCYGKEADPTHGVVARYVQDHVTRRPAVGGNARWPSFDALRTICIYYQPFTTDQLDAAIAAFRAS